MNMLFGWVFFQTGAKTRAKQCSLPIVLRNLIQLLRCSRYLDKNPNVVCVSSSIVDLGEGRGINASAIYSIQYCHPSIDTDSPCALCSLVHNLNCLSTIPYYKKTIPLSFFSSQGSRPSKSHVMRCIINLPGCSGTFRCLIYFSFTQQPCMLQEPDCSREGVRARCCHSELGLLPSA